MPIYEYECKSCGRLLEVLQKVDSPAPEACESCTKGPLIKVMSRTGFILKGGGWYVTDFRGGSKPAAAAAGDVAKSEPAASKESGTVSSPETKAGDSGGSTGSSGPKPAV